jgi:hypothetical protein
MIQTIELHEFLYQKEEKKWGDEFQKKILVRHSQKPAKEES